MRGFQTARALIIDDDYSEIAPAVCALGRMGIGLVFHHAAPESEPDRIEGIHLVFLDMVLGELCADPNDEKHVVLSALERLKALVPPDDITPLLIVCWTKHVEFVDSFRAAFREAYGDLGTVIGSSKPVLGEEQECIDRVIREVGKGHLVMSPLHSLFEWQQVVHNAATRTTRAVLQTVSDCKRHKSCEQGEAAAYVLALMALAEGGKACAKAEAVANAGLGRTLSALLTDRLEVEEWTGLGTSDAGSAIHSKVKSIAGVDSRGEERYVDVPYELSTSLNSMLLLGPPAHDPMFPGQILDWSKAQPLKSQLTRALKDEFLQDTFFTERERSSHSDKVVVCVSMVPPCDFVQSKARMGIFLLGCFTKSLDQVREKAHFVKTIGPLLIPGATEMGWLVMNFHYIVTLTRKQASGCKEATVGRIRELPLNDLLHAYHSHSSRFGFSRISNEDYIGPTNGGKSGEVDKGVQETEIEASGSLDRRESDSGSASHPITRSEVVGEGQMQSPHSEIGSPAKLN